MCVNDFLGANPGVLVCDVLESKNCGFVLDCDDGSCQRVGSGGGGTEGSKEESSRMETTELTSGCARGTKIGAEDLVDEID